MGHRPNMLSLSRRVATPVCRQGMTRALSTTRVVKDDGLTILEEKDHATGRRLQEIEYQEATGLDLFNRDPLRGPYGTKANPCMVPSEYDSRLVGCPGGCTPDAPDYVRWFLLRRGPIHECPDCGQKFKLQKIHVPEGHPPYADHPELPGAGHH